MGLCRRDVLAGTEDRALLLLGFVAALRRSELVRLQREHLTVTAEGLRLPTPRQGRSGGEGWGGATELHRIPIVISHADDPASLTSLIGSQTQRLR